MSLKPKQAIPMSADTQAWWYEERGAISIYMQQKNGNIISARIRKSALVKFIKRSKP